MQNEHDDSVITCEKCNKSCKGGRKFKTHMNSHREVETLWKEDPVEKSQRSTVQYNVLHAGFAKSSDLQIRKPKTKKVVNICYV